MVLPRDWKGFKGCLRVFEGFQPHGQVVDESLAQKMQPFVVGIIHGYDMVPQLSHKSLQAPRSPHCKPFRTGLSIYIYTDLYK